MTRHQLRELRRGLTFRGEWPPLGLYFYTRCPACFSAIPYLMQSEEISFDALIDGVTRRLFVEAVRACARKRSAAIEQHNHRCPCRN